MQTSFCEPSNSTIAPLKWVASHQSRSRRKRGISAKSVAELSAQTDQFALNLRIFILPADAFPFRRGAGDSAGDVA
jgi:hypothetical protein